MRYLKYWFCCKFSYSTASCNILITQWMPLKTFIIALLILLSSFPSLKSVKTRKIIIFLLYHKPSLILLTWLYMVTNELLIIWLLPPRDCRFYDFFFPSYTLDCDLFLSPYEISKIPRVCLKKSAQANRLGTEWF